MADEKRTLHYGGNEFDFSGYDGNPLDGLETISYNLGEGRWLTITVEGTPIAFETAPKRSGGVIGFS